MHIIVEGMDRVGKNTQIEQLLLSFPDLVFHKLHYTKLPFKDKNKIRDYSEKLYKDLLNLLNNKDINFISNRSYIGEYVYSQKYRGYDGSYVFDLEKEFDLENVYLIVLVNSNIVMLQTRDDGDSLSSKTKDLIEEYNLFKEAYNKSKIKNKIFIDCEDLSIDNLSFLINTFIKNGK